MNTEKKTPNKKLYVQADDGNWYEVEYDKEKVLQAVKETNDDNFYEKFENWLNDPDDDSDFETDIYMDEAILAEIVSPDDPVQDPS